MNSEQLPASWHAFGASVRGSSHEKTGQGNQDALSIVNDKFGQIFVAVADGHGNSRSFRSAQGSKFAVECAVRELARFIAFLPPDLTLSQLRRHVRAAWPQQILQAWRSAVRSDLLSHPFTFKDFAHTNETVPNLKPEQDLTPPAALSYGTTLLSLAITQDYILFTQLGDGDIITVSHDGKVHRPLAGDPRIHGNSTPSLCGINPHPSFRIAIQRLEETGPALILLSTDGYANCYGSAEHFDTVAAGLLTYVKESGEDVIRDNLEAWLKESTRTGSGDDITAVVIVRDGLDQIASPTEVSSESASSPETSG